MDNERKNLRFVTDAEGRKTAVILLIEEYEEMMEDLEMGRAARESKAQPRRPFEVEIESPTFGVNPSVGCQAPGPEGTDKGQQFSSFGLDLFAFCFHSVNVYMVFQLRFQGDFA